jgi:organic hydroperoxide reductase OsmC/OhrA
MKRSEHKVNIDWKNTREDLSYFTYDRSHSWKFEGGKIVLASSAPEYGGKIEFVNPEEALAAAVASCHMLSFLYVASKGKWVVDHYKDKAIGILDKNEKGQIAVTQLFLRPVITFRGDKIPTEALVNEMHQKAHNECFIARSVLTEIIIQPQFRSPQITKNEH